jgi:hypothetical protein
MSEPMNDIQTTLYIRNRKISQIQACSNHLKNAPKSSRPNGADMKQVRSATMKSHESLNEAGDEATKLSRVNCPCVLLGADECQRDNGTQ